jgi:hypothetical protein
VTKPYQLLLRIAGRVVEFRIFPLFDQPAIDSRLRRPDRRRYLALTKTVEPQIQALAFCASFSCRLASRRRAA